MKMHLTMNLAIRLLGILAFSLLAACAHQSASATGDLAEGVSENGADDQLKALADTGGSEVNPLAKLNNSEMALEGTKESEAAPTAFESRIPSTDELVAEMKAEPATTAISGQIAQGQAEVLVAQVETLKAPVELIEPKPLLMAKASKMKMDPGVVPQNPSAVAAPKEEGRRPDSVNFPENATSVPADRGTQELGSDAPTLMEPAEDQIKSEIEKEKTLASPEVGGVIMRPWFPWVAIMSGCIGFFVLAMVRFRRRRVTTIE